MSTYALPRRYVLSVFACLTWRPLFAKALPISVFEEPVEMLRRLTFEVSCSNPGAKQIDAQSLWVYGPVSHTGIQSLRSVDCSVPWAQSTDVLGNTVMRLTMPVLTAYATHVIHLTVDVAMRKQPSPTLLELPADWCRSERLMDVNDPQIQAVALTLQRPSRMDAVKAIYDWVRTHLDDADYVPDDLGASVALAQRRGDCTEFAYLVAALARALSIPARVMGGFVCEHDDAPKAAQYHNWAEVYVDGTWRLVDAQKQVFLSSCEQYVAFRVCSDRLLSPLKQANRFYTESPAKLYFR